MKTLLMLVTALFLVSCSHSHKSHKSGRGHSCSKDQKTCKIKKCDCKGGAVWFISPKDGETVSSPFKVIFGVKGMSVRPAGELVEGTGHHHLIVNGQPIGKEAVVPNDAKHIHFGKGQTETELTLPKGKHTLTLQFADGAHRSYGEPLSATIMVNVK